MTLSLVGNAQLRELLRRNLVTFPAQIRPFGRPASGDIRLRLVQLYFVRGWSVRDLCARYGLSKAIVRGLLGEWRNRAIESGFIQEIEPGLTTVSTEEDHVNDADDEPVFIEHSGATWRAMPGVPAADAESAGSSTSEAKTAGAGDTDRETSQEHNARVHLSSPRGKLLVAHGDTSVRRAVYKAFNHLGFEISEACTGDEVLALCRFTPYEAVVLDIEMPGKSGIETSRELRRLMHRTAIIMLSDNDDHERNIEALEVGADDYLTKPFHMGELAARIRAARRQYQTMPEDGDRADELTISAQPDSTNKSAAELVHRRR